MIYSNVSNQVTSYFNVESPGYKQTMFLIDPPIFVLVKQKYAYLAESVFLKEMKDLVGYLNVCDLICCEKKFFHND